jgi:hypothetical protein
MLPGCSLSLFHQPATLFEGSKTVLLSFIVFADIRTEKGFVF